METVIDTSGVSYTHKGVWSRIKVLWKLYHRTGTLNRKLYAMNYTFQSKWQGWNNWQKKVRYKTKIIKNQRKEVIQNSTIHTSSLTTNFIFSFTCRGLWFVIARTYKSRSTSRTIVRPCECLVIDVLLWQTSPKWKLLFGLYE